MDMETKIEELLSEMTLEEKVRQMQMLDDSMSVVEDGKFSKEKADVVFEGKGIGCVQIFQLRDLPPEQLRAVIDDLQAYLREHTRHGIPALVVGESLHGVVAPGATVFPQSIGLSCSWNGELVERVAESIAREAESLGLSQVLAPDLDLARDPRWGRVEETYGEDPYLTGELGARYIRGIQKSGTLAATLKHFVAHGNPESGVNLAPVSAGERQIRDLFLPPFEKCLREKPLSVMPAYSEIDGKPCSSSKKVLTGLLRDELGFDGYTISDYMAIEMLHNFHLTAENPKEAGRQALQAGMDLEAPNEYGFGKNLIELAEEGKISVEDIDKAVRRILYVKMRLGLFERRHEPTQVFFRSEQARALALEAAEESIVLLKNEDVLPLSVETKKIAVIGPNANTAQLGDYCVARDGISILEGIKEIFDGEICYAKGCGIYSRDESSLRQAVSASDQADMVILALGGSSMADGGVGWGDESSKAEVTCGEGFDSADLKLSAAQMELAEKVFETGKPVVLVLEDGRPCAIPEIYDRAAAILHAWYPGQEGGRAVAKILFGLTNPSAKLTVSIPKHVGQVPMCYNHKPSARGFYHRHGSPEKPGRDYVFLDTKPYYEFGFGFSYTTFAYSNLKVDASDPENILVSVDVKNTGSREGKETALLFLSDLVSTVTTPVKALKGFEKVSLLPDETKTVSFTLGFEELYLINDEMEKEVEEGWFEVEIGGLKDRFYVTGRKV